MKRTLCLVVIVMTVFLGESGIAGAGAEPVIEYTPSNMWFGLPVFVTNSESNPVPVKGNLGITGTADVNIVNTDTTPVPVRNPNEPGRVPYEIDILIMFGQDIGSQPDCLLWQESQTESVCPNLGKVYTNIFFDLPDVPVGKRLIMKRVSGKVQIGDPEGAFISFHPERSTSPPPRRWKWVFPGPFFLYWEDLGIYVFDSGDLYFTYGPGETPHVVIHAPHYYDYPEDMSSIAFSGYLIDAD